MATLNLSANGPSISKSYQSVISSPAPTGPTASSTYGQWAVFSVSTPLVNAFQQDTISKESVLKVQSTGEGELVDLIDEFSDGKVQFAFVKVKDPNTSLPKYVLVGWCGEGVPERTKGYFTSHQAAVTKVLHGYHVQMTARSDRDLTPEGIVQKVADASGSKYSAGDSIMNTGPHSPVASKPAFMPTQRSGGTSGFNPLSRPTRDNLDRQRKVDEDGWGEDAPPVTRTQLEKVQSAYKPTTVNIKELSSQSQEPSRSLDTSTHNAGSSDVVKGTYHPVGKIDIAAIRREAQASGKISEDRPTVVKRSYEPTGKVDIAAIRERAQNSSVDAPSLPTSTPHGFAGEGSYPESSTLPKTSERLTTLPKPKVSNKFGSGPASFAGTKAPTPGGFGFEAKLSPSAPPIGASRAFADQGGKTPAQLWAEKKARQGGSIGLPPQSSVTAPGNLKSPIVNQISSGGEWKSGYSGKTWAPVQTMKTGQSAASVDESQLEHHEEQDNEHSDVRSSAEDISSIRDKFRNASVGEAVRERSAPSPPALDVSNKPNAGRGIPIPGLTKQVGGHEEDYSRPKLPTPPPQPRSPTPPTPEEVTGSPIRVAMPVPRGLPDVGNAHEEQFSPLLPLPLPSLAKEVSRQGGLEDDEPEAHDAGRSAASTLASVNFNHETSETPEISHTGKRALVQYDYEKAEDNELELREGEFVTDIEMVDNDWWMGRDSRGESGLFPSNYVELVEHEHLDTSAEEQQMTQEAVGEAAPTVGPIGGSGGSIATALYDYEAAEDNELTFPEGAKITNVEFPDEDWWSGDYEGHSGLFPANYVQLNG